MIQNADELEGKLVTFSVACKIKISGQQGQAQDGTPIHAVLAKGPHGHYAEVGVAFRRTLNKGEFSGHAMFNMLFDQEGDFPFKAPVTAWPRGEGRWELATDRKRQEQAQDAPADAAA